MHCPQADMRPGQSVLELQLYDGFCVAQVSDSAKVVPLVMAPGIIEAWMGNVDTLVMELVAGLKAESV